MNIQRLIALSALVLALAVSGWAANKKTASSSPREVKVTEQSPPATQSGRTRVVSEPQQAEPVTAQPLELPGTDVELDRAPSPTAAGAGAASYDIPWQSINGGGSPSSSANYSVNASVGQSAIGYATSTNYEAGIGYWYGAEAAGGGCSCPFQSDFDEDGFRTALDLSEMIDILFAGHTDVQDPTCPNPRADFDCDGFSTALDLSGLIDHLFASGPPPCDPCA